MSRGLRLFGGIVAGIVVLGLALGGLWFWFSRRAIPETRGTVNVAGLAAEVEILRDEFGVPHIYADSPDDLFFAQGYAHAQERFWQMEFQRRTGAGRLSEIFGEATLGTDRYLRNFGFHELASAAYELADPETKRILDAYAAGVNAYIEDRTPAQLALEFAIVGLQGVEIEIEPWTPPDSLIWGEMLIFDQSDQLRTELRNIDLLAAVGERMYQDLTPAYRADRPVIVTTEELVTIPQGPAATRSNLGGPELAYLLAIRKSMQFHEMVLLNWQKWGSDSLEDRTVLPFPEKKPNPDGPCWLTTLIWVSRRRRSGMRLGCTAWKNPRIASTISVVSHSRASRES